MDDLPIILVAEDESLLQELVKDALHYGGFGMTVSPNAAEAVELLKSGAVRYRALVTDIYLQGSSNGWELAREVREIDPSFPVVYLTGAAADGWTSQRVPNSVLLEKPFAPAQLVAAILQLLDIGGKPSFSSPG